jgi:spore germination protein KA
MNKQKEQPLTPFSGSLQVNLQTIRHCFGDSSDVVIRLFSSDAVPGRSLAIAYVDGITDAEMINLSIMEPLMSLKLPPEADRRKTRLLDALRSCVISVGRVDKSDFIQEALQAMADGLCLIMVDGIPAALMAEVRGGERRDAGAARTQTVIRGPQSGFAEHLRTNISLIRSMIRSADLHVQIHKLGSQTHSDVAVLFLHGVVDDGILKEVYRRLAAIDIDGILENGCIEDFIQDESFTPFPTILNTERPDAVAAGLLEGRVAIMVDGSPLALIAPTTFFAFFESAEDNYQRYDIAVFIRMIRYAAYAIAMLLPALYIAVTTFHQEMLPAALLMSLMTQREGIAFPALAELLLMEATFEVLREAGLRMPRTIGPALSIIGALALGQAGVQTGIVSAGVVTVVALTAISSFVIPEYSMAATTRLTRFMFTLMGGLLGFFGIFVSVLILLVHLASLRSLGMPYLSPLASGGARQGMWREVFVRRPWWTMVLRPLDIKLLNPRRRPDRRKPAVQRHSGKPS